MGKLCNKMATICCTYNDNLENVVGKNGQGALEDNHRMMEFALVDPLYDVRRSRNEESANYDLFSSEDIKDMINMLEDVISLETYSHLFYWSL